MPRRIVELSAELALLLALLSAPPDQGEIRRRAALVGDWQHFLCLLRRHRVVSLAGLRLPADVIPDEIAAKIQQSKIGLARRTLLQVAEASRLIALLEAKDVPCLLLKGLPLSVRVYGAPLLRDCRDIDLLISPQALQRGLKVLGDAGLRMVKAERTWPLIRRYAHDILFTSPSGVTIELKARLHATPSLQSEQIDGMLARRTHLSVMGVEMPVMSKQDLLPYLCAHGARHCWFRLRWLADVAALLSTQDEADLDGLWAAAERSGIEVPVLEAMMLAGDWLGVDIPQRMVALAGDSRAVLGRRPLVERAVREVGANGDPMTIPGYQRLLDRSEYSLRPDLGYRLDVLERQTVVWGGGAIRRFFTSERRR